MMCKLRAHCAAAAHAAAAPEQDAVVQVVVALQPLVSRETSPTDSAVVSVSEFNTGGTLRRLRAD